MIRGHLPFLYMEKAKRPGQSYLLKVMMGDDYAVLFLGLALAHPAPLLAALMLFFYHTSFWCIYEAGYVDNDIQGSTHESRPHLAAGWQEYHRRFSFVAA